MSSLVNVGFWLLFTVVGVIVEMLIPRIDAFVAGILVLLQERRYASLLWVLPLFVAIQEGLGTRMFGGSIVWYAVVILLFFVGERFFTTDTVPFVLAISAAYGCAFYGLHILMAPLQELAIDTGKLMDVAILQAVVIPVVWRICRYARRTETPKDE
ncbi:MAG: hypothetical protein IJS54_00380 [Desulfovibrio sp.]|nr:hypothetical protein [Desulfovibrio sp.]